MGYFPQNATKIDEPLVKTTSPRDDLIDTMLGGKTKYGKLFTREHRADLMDQWMAPKGIIEYIPEVKSEGIMIPAQGEYPDRANAGGIKLTHSKFDINMRDTGLYATLEHNFRQHLIDYMKSDEGQGLAASLNKLGCNADDIEYIAIGFIPDKAIYAIGRLPDGKVVIYANKDSHKKIADWAEKGNTKIEELREAAIGEELVHNFRRSYDKRQGRISEEKTTKETLLEFYETLAKTTSNSELKAKYARIIAHLKHDISTVSRYAKINSNSLQDLVDIYNTDVSELESILEAQAINEGINTKEGIAEYVSEKLGEIAEAAENEYSEKDGVVEDLDEEMSEYDEGELSDGEVAEAEACAEAEADGDSGGNADGAERE